MVQPAGMFESLHILSLLAVAVVNTSSAHYLLLRTVQMQLDKVVDCSSYHVADGAWLHNRANAPLPDAAGSYGNPSSNTPDTCVQVFAPP